ncbi:MAG: outer membrane protein assembly factor BamD [Myxococcota bacterium]
MRILPERSRLCGATRVGLVTLAFLTGCASAPPLDEAPPTAESYYQRGLEVLEGRRVLLLFRDVDSAQAIELFQEVIDNYPYSDQAKLAMLKIGDVHFDQKAYDEAASYYQDFVELYTTHPEVPYAIYRLGLCSFSKMQAAGRDQTATHKAIEQFQVLSDRYPDSPWVADARERLVEATDHLAEHDVEIGDFYLERRDCHAAAGRYRRALADSPTQRARPRTLLQLARALECMRSPDEAIDTYRQLLREERDSDAATQAREALARLGVPVPKAPTESAAGTSRHRRWLLF